VIQRDARLLDLWAQRKTLAQIAETEGYANPKSAWRALQRAIKRLPPTEDVELRRTRDLRMYDALLELANSAARQINYVVSQAGQIVYGPSGRPLIDFGPNLKAMDAIVRMNARMAAISGEDVPQRLRIEYVDAETMDQLLAAEEAETNQLSELEQRLRAEGKVIDMPMLETGTE
jgi:cell division protein FtsB